MAGTDQTLSHPAAGGELLRGRVFKYGDNVNTDVIFPGKYTYTLRRPDEIAPHALEDLDPDFVRRVRPGDMVVAGHNWGCGSSREQAATCLVANGVRAVIAKSFARIFYRNAINNGLLVLPCGEAVDFVQDGDTLEVDLAASKIGCRGREFSFPATSPTLRQLIDAGGLIPYVKSRLDP